MIKGDIITKFCYNVNARLAWGLYTFVNRLDGEPHDVEIHAEFKDFHEHIISSFGEDWEQWMKKRVNISNIEEMCLSPKVVSIMKNKYYLDLFKKDNIIFFHSTLPTNKKLILTKK